MRTIALASVVMIAFIAVTGAQKPPDPAAREALAAATAVDHQDMMQQLGIRTLRPGPSGNEAAPNHANYDDALANPYPNLPDPLALRNGRKVTSASAWNTERRPEIVEGFEREVLGRIPHAVPKVTWSETGREELDGWSAAGRRPAAGRARGQLVVSVDCG